MITKFKETYDVQYNLNKQTAVTKTVCYLYDTEDERADHQIVMEHEGFISSTQKEKNFGSLHNPDYRLFSEYIKMEYRPTISLVNKSDILKLLNKQKETVTVDIKQIIDLINQLPEVSA